DAALPGVPLQLAQLRLWPYPRQPIRVRARLLDRDVAGDGDVRVHRRAERRPRAGRVHHRRPFSTPEVGPQPGRICGDRLDRGLWNPDRYARPKGANLKVASEALKITPLDVHNQALLARVHPPGWRNPTPAPRYNLVVVGAGTAGLVSAVGAAGLGARVALVEREFLGGDCLNVGCVPSKALIRASRAAAEVRGAHDCGVEVPAGTRVNFPAVMERMRRLRAALSPNDSAARYRGLGVDVFFGEARFTGPDAVEVGGRVLRFRRAVIATGARAARPDIPGLAE